MPATPHVEKHFTATETVRDVVIGMADGLTVPFALAAGLAAAVSSTKVIVTAGLAEIVAGAIAMGLGGYLAARTDAEHYASEQAREDWEIDNLREKEVQEVTRYSRGYGLTGRDTENGSQRVNGGSQTVARLHDALRTWPGNARSKTRADQCRDDRGSYLVGGINSADALYPDVEHFGAHSHIRSDLQAWLLWYSAE